MSQDLPIILTFDENFAHAGYVVMQSIMDTSPADQKHSFYVLHENLSAMVIEIGKTLFNTENSHIHFVNLSEEMKKIRISRHTKWHRSVFYRLLIPQLFQKFDQVLYLDSDVIAIENVYEIADEVPEDGVLGVTEDTLFPQNDRDNRVSFVDTIPNFYSGLLFFRPKNISQDKVKFYLKLTARPFAMPDQDILNLMFHEVATILPDRWDFVTGTSEGVFHHLDERIKEQREIERPLVRIYHYPGPKPWQQDMANAEHFWRSERALQKRLHHVGEILIKKYLPMP